MTVTDQPRLPGWCWTCNGCGRVTVAVMISGEAGEPECRTFETACPDCAIAPGRRAWAEAIRGMLQQPTDGR
jgi:hypothetical protein